MILLRCHVLGFGKLSDRRFEFDPGLNVVYAPNEGGKSTLQRVLVGLLYGQLRADLRVQRRMDPWVEAFRPWGGAEYGGVLWVRLGDGREVEIRRAFGREETRIEIRAASGEEITRHYDQQRNGEVLFAQTHLGIPKGLFESVAIVRENQVTGISGYEAIRDRIANLAQSGDEELSTRGSLAKIQDRLDALGSDRAPTKPYRQAQDLVAALAAERQEALSRRKQFEGWLEDRDRISGEIRDLERELARAGTAVLAARRREMIVRVRSLKELDQDLGAIGAELEGLGGRADFPVEGLEELDRLTGARESLARRLQEVGTARSAAESALAHAASARSELLPYADLAAGSEADRITEWFVTYLGLSLQKDGVQKTRQRLAAEAAAVKERLAGRSPAAADGTDWQRLAREAVEDEQEADRQGALLAGTIAGEKVRRGEAGRIVRRWRLLAAGCGALAVVPSAWGLADGFGRIPLPYAVGIGAVLAAVAVLFFVLARRGSVAALDLERSIRALEAEMTAVREKGGGKRKELDAVLAASGFRKLEDFLAAARQCELDRERLSGIEARLAETDAQAGRLDSESEECYRLLKESLGKVGLPCSPGSLKFQVDTARANLRRFRELDARHGGCAVKVRDLAAEHESLEREYRATCARVEAMLTDAGVASAEEFRQECARRRRLEELTERQASRAREFQRLAEGLSLEEWEGKLEELSGKVGPEEAVPAPDAGPARFLPYLPSIAEAEAEAARTAERLAAAREEHAAAVERVRHAFHNVRPVSEIEEDLALAEERLNGLEMNRNALSIACEAIETISRQQQEVLAPQLNGEVERRFLRLSRGRYQEVKVDPDFQIWVRESETGELRLAEHLSRGTQDQIYFATRFAILDMISSETDRCPSLLDEPFAAYDRPRLGEAFEVLVSEAARRQLIVFTCREELPEMALGRGAKVIRL